MRMAGLPGLSRRVDAGTSQDGALRTNRYRKRVLSSMADAGLDAVICAAHPLPALRHGGSYLLGSVAGSTFLWNVMGVPSGSAAVTRVREDEQASREPRTRDRVMRAAAETDAGSPGLPVRVHVLAPPSPEDLFL